MTPSRIFNPADEMHFANLEPVEGIYSVVRDGVLLCQSDQTVRLSELFGEKRYPPILYFPLDSLTDAVAPVAGRSTHCPLKGAAAYFAVGETEVGWTYDRPIPEAQFLDKYVAFYSDRVSISHG